MFFPNAPRIGQFELVAGFGAVLLLVWLAFGVWAFRDMRLRSRSVWLAILAALLVLVLPIAGLVIYLLLRPRETLIQRYERTLQQEVLLQQIESNPTCPGCGRAVDERWLVCPDCHVSLRRACRHCGAALEAHWQICPFCARVTERPEPEGVQTPEPAEATLMASGEAREIS